MNGDTTRYRPMIAKLMQVLSISQSWCSRPSSAHTRSTARLAEKISIHLRLKTMVVPPTRTAHSTEQVRHVPLRARRQEACAEPSRAVGGRFQGEVVHLRLGRQRIAGAGDC